MDARFATEFFHDSDVEDEEDQATSEEDLAQLDETIKNISKQLRKGDWTYLGRHPEVRAIIRVIITQAVKKNPENIFNFAAHLFRPKNQKKLTRMINKQLKWVNRQVRSGVWSPPDGVEEFPESSSSSFCGRTCDPPIYTDLSDDCHELFVGPNMCPETFKPSC